MKPSLANLFAAAYLLGHATLGLAQDADNIYQIEIIIFERPNQDGSEYWPKNIDLSYPDNLATLIDPEKEAERKAQASEALAQRESFALSPEFLNSIQAEQTATEDTNSTVDERSTSAEEQRAQSTTEQNAAEAPAKIPLNTFLAPSLKRLAREKTALEQQRNYRVLFHETWLQALEPTAEARALPISAGKQFGDHRELEGYISLSLNRYLHFEGHLWLTEFVANYGQPLEHWPALPTPQRADEQNKVNAATLLQMNEGYVHLADMPLGQPAAIEWTGPQSDPYAELLEAPYLIKNIAVLQQNRRMRSGELHYLDHPKMGILIKMERAAEQ